MHLYHWLKCKPQADFQQMWRAVFEAKPNAEDMEGTEPALLGWKEATTNKQGSFAAAEIHKQLRTKLTHKDITGGEDRRDPRMKALRTNTPTRGPVSDGADFTRAAPQQPVLWGREHA